ncbi:very short patch repair endonuclease [Ralstonia pseudosolanacearum]|uniref:very short patch repair endonuclease n=1 Tax=Ralstonia pseudosolanacearum TaxID=1310165 RepID=UPI002676FC6A|nr:very short patch repair endonuclease [Ralstonia pseudosolanacearum]MDO3507186.1 very short patch repair endonuclease [Ralstonia pseudosolanacearum]MDO3514034.1 very short patch repair endonuclease [Ralstonia pseudosolanacearum]MDO3538587.1 very short patch repair endonuclease [Ralstonia pseudosolanacearum]MDO3606890.1 very short patch repair endonuclease [Ralstonia pseudosolanacearum]MDO3611391.1 very short patch repair endonuclease [Ralstonia pseudosolanacearum]
MDRLTPDRRSRLMSRIRSKDTKPEVEVRSTLHRMGYRYVLHRRGLPGTPDLVFPARRKVLFVHGCYWHGHTCKYGKAQSKSNVEFWQKKIDANRRRDRRNTRKLRAAGWSVATVWECQIKQRKWLDRIVLFLES